MTVDARAARDDDLAVRRLQPPTLWIAWSPARSSPVDSTPSSKGARRFVLISAPAGPAKSTIIATWLDGRPEPGAWLQVDAGDNDPARFWTSFAAAVDRVARGRLAAAR